MRLHAVIGFGTVLAFAFAITGCAYTKKKLPPKETYAASYLGSTDGTHFHALIDLMELAERAKSSCRAIERQYPIRAQYTVQRSDTGIIVTVDSCESKHTPNCDRVRKCLTARPVAWLSRATGATPALSGVIYTDWLGRCGGRIGVNFYMSGQNELPVEKVSCVEPKHDTVDTGYEMFLVTRPELEKQPAVGPYIENLLRKWNMIVFHEVDSVPPL